MIFDRLVHMRVFASQLRYQIQNGMYSPGTLRSFVLPLAFRSMISLIRNSLLILRFLRYTSIFSSSVESEWLLRPAQQDAEFAWDDESRH